MLTRAKIEEEISGLYLTTIGRSPDLAGVSYWTDEVVNGKLTVAEVGQSFFDQKEVKNKYDGLSTLDFINNVYQNVLGREAEQDGLNYWEEQLNSNAFSKDRFIEAVNNGVLGDDALRLENMKTVGYYYMKNVGYDNDFAKQVLQAIDKNSNTKADAIALIDFYKGHVEKLQTATNQELSTLWTNINNDEYLSSLGTSSEIIAFKDKDDTFWENAQSDFLNDSSSWVTGNTTYDKYINNQLSSLTISDINTQSSNTQSLANTNNGLGTLSSSAVFGVSSIDSKVYWEKDVITFSFNDSIPIDYYEYEQDSSSNQFSSLTTNWKALDEEQKSTVVLVMNEVNKFLGITLKEVSEDGMIKFNSVQTDSNTSGFAFLPGENFGYEGDVFLTNSFNDTPEVYGLKQGEQGWTTIVHELGHALGLEHTFEGFDILSTVYDDIYHSVMSYTTTNTYVPMLSFKTENSINMDLSPLGPQLYSTYDVSALQAIYGVNTTTNIEDNVYTFKFDDYTIESLWDAGGTDTIDLSSTIGNNTIDLRAGSLNSADEYTLANIVSLHQETANNLDKSQFNEWIEETITSYYESNTLYTGKNNLAIANGVIIENITTGTGVDIITDNEVDNQIYTSAGNDKIYLGNGGYDYVDAGTGEDILYLNLLPEQIEIQTQDNKTYTLTADTFKVDFTNIEEITFSNGVTQIPEDIV